MQDVDQVCRRADDRAALRALAHIWHGEEVLKVRVVTGDQLKLLRDQIAANCRQGARANAVQLTG